MGKAPSGKLESELARYFERKIEIDRLREKHKLTPRDLVTGPKEEMPARVAAYTEELETFLKQWRAQDAAETPREQEAQAHEARSRQR